MVRLRLDFTKVDQRDSDGHSAAPLLPDFAADTTMGHIKFHEWIGDKWAIFFSHPKDFTPVCTTELGTAAKMKADFDKRNVKMIAISVDDVDSHKRWTGDIEDTQKTTMNFPIIGDADKKVANLYGMIHPEANDTLTVRSVFFIDPNKKVRAMITYPRGPELRQAPARDRLAPAHRPPQVATPANWKDGEDCVIVPAVTDEQRGMFPKGMEALRPYLRMTHSQQVTLFDRIRQARGNAVPRARLIRTGDGRPRRWGWDALARLRRRRVQGRMLRIRPASCSVRACDGRAAPRPAPGGSP